MLDNAQVEMVATLHELLPRRRKEGDMLMTTRTKQIAESIATASGKGHTHLGLSISTEADAV